MKEKLLNHFMKIGPRRFVVSAVIMLLILDILNGIYFKIFWVQTNMSQKILLKSMEGKGELAPETIVEVIELINASFAFFLFVIFVNNLFFYLFYLRKKLWAQGYVLFYAFSAAMFSVATLFMGAVLGPAWFIFTLINIPLYLYLYFGVKLLKNETTLVPQKKAR
jgi:hypothetical protein